MKAMLCLVTLLFFNVHILADQVKVESVSFKDKGAKGLLTVKLSDEPSSDPELLIRDKMIQVSIPGSFVWPKIEKNLSMVSQYDAKVLAYQYDKKIVRVRTSLPFNIKKKENRVALTVKGKYIYISFPKKARKIASSIKKKVIKESSDGYDDSYLEKLLQDTKENKRVKKSKPIQLKESSIKDIKEEIEKSDSVKTVFSAPAKKTTKSNFSITQYVGKFIGFLALIVLFFYGIVAMLRKGTMKKGRLGFLNSTKLVEVLGTTYVSPKKSLLLIKAHEQVFLVSNTDTGMNLISEINDMNGLFKEGEKQVSGINFDTELGSAESTPKVFKTKEILDIPAEEEVDDKVKFSDQIKKKMKSLKSLQ